MVVDIAQALGVRTPENLIATKVSSPGMTRASLAVQALREHYGWDPASPNPNNPQVTVSGLNDEEITIANWDETILGPAPTIDELVAMVEVPVAK